MFNGRSTAARLCSGKYIVYTYSTSFLVYSQTGPAHEGVLTVTNFNVFFLLAQLSNICIDSTTDTVVSVCNG